MEKVIYSSNQGTGIIMASTETESDYIAKTNIMVLDTEITPGQKTTLSGMFTSEVTYCGILRDEPTISPCMVFLLGDHADLFAKIRYYACLYWISPTRLVNKYKEGTARDFIWKNGKWK